MNFRFLTNSKLLWWISGEDPQIVRYCEPEVKLRISIIGLCVLVIAIISGISIALGVREVLESYYFGLPIGIYAAILVFLLYEFLLLTFTKGILPRTEDGTDKVSSSKISRIGFLVILGVAVSQPIEHFLFSNQVNDLLSEEIARSIENKSQALNQEYYYKIEEFTSTNRQKKELENTLINLRQEKEARLQEYWRYQYNRNFFIQKLILMDSSLQTAYIWLFSLVFVLIFVSPIYLKSKIGLDTSYYKIKKEIQLSIVQNHHKQFVQCHDQIFASKFNRPDIKWKTRYLDPPFNTKLIEESIYKSDLDFSKWLLDEGN